MADVRALSDVPTEYTDAQATDLLYLARAGIPGKIRVEKVLESTPGRLLNEQIITATGAFTYTPTAGTKMARIILGAGGGGGGGADGDGANYGGGGSGGGSGEILDTLFTVRDGNNYGGTIGAGGAGGNGGDGADGADTTFQNTTDTARLDLTAKGGSKGNGAEFTVTAASLGGFGSSSGTATGTDILASLIHHGAYGHGGIFISGGDVSGSGTALGGNGGQTIQGRAGRGGRVAAGNSTDNGNPGQLSCGGGGGVAVGNTAWAVGGDGGDGFVRIQEFS